MFLLLCTGIANAQDIGKLVWLASNHDKKMGELVVMATNARCDRSPSAYKNFPDGFQKYSEALKYAELASWVEDKKAEDSFLKKSGSGCWYKDNNKYVFYGLGEANGLKGKKFKYIFSNNQLIDPKQADF